MKHLTKTQVLAVLSEARLHSERNYLAILIAYLHACRISEVCALTTLNFQGNELVIARLKGSKKTTQPLLGNAEPLLDERTNVLAWLDGLKHGQRLIGIERSMLSKHFVTYCRKAGVPQTLRNFHVLKHSAAHHALDGGARINAVQKYLGHASLASTGRYLEIDDATASADVQQALAA
jgi:integrase/recombinase XerC